MPGPATYNTATDRNVHAKPPPPTLGPANTILTDPTYGNRILRVSDRTMFGGVSIRSLGGAGNTQAWNLDSTRFLTTDTGGGCQLWTFNAATMQATFVRTLNIIASVNAVFSLLDPDILYGVSSSFTEATAVKYNCLLDTYTKVVGVRTLVPTVDDAGRTYMRGVSTGVSGGVEYINLLFGGQGQDQDFYAYWGPINNIAAGKTLNTIANTINGVALSGGQTIGVYMHATHVDMSGRYVNLACTNQSPAPWIIWDTTTGLFVRVPLAADHSGGHGATGYVYTMNTPDDEDGMDTRLRSYATPHTTTQLGTPYPSPSDFSNENHASWSNADPSALVPVIAAFFRYPSSGSGPSSWVPNTVYRAFSDEVVAMSTDGSNIVYRFCHHRSNCNNRDDATFDFFWSMPRPNVSMDGKWALFTSNWELTLGTDTNGGLKRQDAFIVELPTTAAPSGGTPPPAPPPSLHRRHGRFHR